MNVHFLTHNETVRQKVASFIEKWHDDTPFFETQTSGSTGSPKTIRILKVHARKSAEKTLQKLKIEANSNALMALSCDTIGGKMMVVRAIVGDLNLFVTEPSADPLNNLSIQPDFIALVPAQLETVLRQHPEKLKGIRNCIIGGGQLPASLESKLQEHGISVYQTFGMTETISHIALRKAGWQAESAYTLLDGMTISVHNECLVVHAPDLGIDRLETNDIVHVINAKQFQWLGRKDFVVNSGGFKIHPEQVERELENSMNRRFFVGGIPDERWGTQLVILIEGTEDEKYMHKSFYSALSHAYFIPKSVQFVAHFSEVANQKIDRIKTLERTHVDGFKPIL